MWSQMRLPRSCDACGNQLESFRCSSAETTHSWWCATRWLFQLSELHTAPQFIQESTKAEECSWLSQTNKFSWFPVITLMLSVTWGRMGCRNQSIFIQNVEYWDSYSFPLRILFYKECDSLRCLEAQKLKLLFLKHFSFATKILQINSKLNQPTINTTQSTADQACLNSPYQY